jgi:tRNA A-37 threonylcarbamoyl transferase component Bud32
MTTRTTEAELPERIAGYRIEGILGAGGMSRVYAARQVSLDRRVALKVYRLTGSSPSQAIARLRREARLLARLDHENVVRCIDFGEEGETFFLALELVDGESLKSRLDTAQRLPVRDALAITLAVGRGLHHAHLEGIVHRDVKPGNVLLGRDGSIKLADFGLARTIEDPELTQPGTALGTPQYLSPEQARSPRLADERADVYALGATLYHMLGGTPPHRGETLAEVISSILFAAPTPLERLAPGIDPRLSGIVARAMAKDRTRRYASVVEFCADVERFALGRGLETHGLSWDDSSATAPPLEEPEHGGEPPGHGRDRRLVAGGIAAVVLLSALAFLFAPWRTAPRDDTPPSVTPPPPFAAEAVRSGRLTVVAALAALDAARGAHPELRAEIEAEAMIRARRAGDEAAQAARAAIARGAIDAAAREFDRELDRALLVALGAPRDELGAGLGMITGSVFDAAREAAAEQARRIALDADAGFDAAVERFGEEIASLSRESGLLAAERRLAAARDELDAAGIAAFRTALAESWQNVRREPESASAVATSTLAARASEAIPPAEWLAAARERAARALDVHARTLESAARVSQSAATRAIDDFAAPLPEATDARLALRDAAASAAGIEAEALLARFPDLATHIEKRAVALETDRDERASSARRALEAEAAPALAAALSALDLAAARDVVAGLGRGEVRDGWLGTLIAALPEVERTLERALADLESRASQTLRIATRTIVKEGSLSRVDRAARVLVFQKPAFEIAFSELALSEVEQRAGSAATPLARAVLRLLGGDHAGVAAALAGHEAAPWHAPLRAALDDAIEESARRARGESSAAEQALREYDEAMARGDPAAAGDIVTRILREPRLARQEAVRERRAELEKSLETGRAALEVERRRAALVAATRAAVRFLASGEVEVRHDFADPSELADFVTPGKEWRVDSGRLTCLHLLDREGVARIDLFRNRPGLVRALPFDSNRPWRVEFEAKLPLDPRPGLFGVRVGAFCFVIRSFDDDAFEGQVNGWLGALDQFRDHLFEPALGETRPRKASAGTVRPFRLERGNRYRFVLRTQPGASAEVTLEVEGSVVYRAKPSGSLGPCEVEIRSEMPFEIEDLIAVGTVAGVRG